MRTIFALLTLCLTAFTFAADTQYRDEDTGLVMTIPEGFNETWYVRNCKSNFDIKVFNTDEEEEEISIIAVAKIPMCGCLDADIADFIPLIFEQIQDAFDDTLYDEVRMKLVPMPSLVESANSKAFHLEIYSEDLEEQVMQADFHLFFENGFVTTIITGGVFNARFTELTKQVLSHVHFIQE